MIIARRGTSLALALLILLPATPAAADEEAAPRRTRIGLGVQLVPSFPGSDEVNLRPLIDVARTRGDRPYEFEAPDESFGFPLLRAGGLAVGPAIGFEGGRDREDVGGALPEVDFTFEVGAFAQYAFSEKLRVRAEARQGLGGHDGLVGTLGLDFIARDRNEWLLSIGPRVTFADDDYHEAFFSVPASASAASSLPAYSAKGGLQSAGVTAGYIKQLTPRWGLYTYAKYDRLLGDPSGSPIIRRFGSRDQLSGGLALTYTFGRPD